MATTGLTLSGAAPGLGSFIASLINDGRVVVSSEPLTPSDESVPPLLFELNDRAQVELAGEAPEFSCEAALWAAELLYQICQSIVCRNIGEDQISAAFARPCPGSRGPSIDWSVDLLFCHLPALFRLARHLSNGDPLVQEMRKLAAEWPLSSVGISELPALNLDSFISHPTLVRLYADRIATGADTSRLGDPRVDELLRADLGIHHELAPEIAAKLFPRRNAAIPLDSLHHFDGSVV